MAFGANQKMHPKLADEGAFEKPAEDRLAVKAHRLHDLIRQRDRHFNQPVMADTTMAVTLSLFLAECRNIVLNEATLALINLLERDESCNIIDSLVHAGFAAATAGAVGRRQVALTPLGSARMRSFISDYPDI